jgi:hypothetical protein
LPLVSRQIPDIIELRVRDSGAGGISSYSVETVEPRRVSFSTGLCTLCAVALCSRALFFYLDAHWNVDLPLAEEIDLVFRRCPAAVVMIDDFPVPSDAGYGYNGPGKALVSDYFEPAVLAHQLRAFYPATPSAVESGGRRGCIVLAKDNCLGPVLASLPLLRPVAEA